MQAGNTFTVALRITSDEPLRASPDFAYRVNPPGSIFVGASGPGNAAADAELLVLTFKSIRPAPSTEVKISSLVLHGQVGKPIAVEPISAYRTSITP